MHRALLRQAVPEIFRVTCCSACGKSTGDMNPAEPHVLQAEVDAQKLLYEQNFDPTEEIIYRRLSKRLWTTSRCCGAVYRYEDADYHLYLWNLWRSRSRLTKPVDVRIARRSYGERNQGRTDDFFKMHAIMGLGDQKTQEIVNIFQQEEARLVAAGKLAPSS